MPSAGFKQLPVDIISSFNFVNAVFMGDPVHQDIGRKLPMGCQCVGFDEESIYCLNALVNKVYMGMFSKIFWAVGIVSCVIGHGGNNGSKGGHDE